MSRLDTRIRVDDGESDMDEMWLVIVNDRAHGIALTTSLRW
jgi:hypothetical protein